MENFLESPDVNERVPSSFQSTVIEMSKETDKSPRGFLKKGTTEASNPPPCYGKFSTNHIWQK